MINRYIVIVFIFLPTFLMGQCFLTGADLSYTNEVLSKGGIYYNENGVEVDPYEYFAFRGCEIARLRLWHTPSNNIDYCGNNMSSSSLEDVLNAAVKIKSNGMQLKLSIHYSDYFVDPNNQEMPLVWNGLSHSVLLDSITNYTNSVLEKLQEQNTLPDIISIGNETTWGFIDETNETNGFNWSVDGDKFNVAFSVIDLFNQTHNTNIKKAVHFTESSAVWASNEFIENGVSNFDIIGISYYPYFSPNTSLNQVGEIINELYTNYGKEVMVFETGFAWSNDYSDSYNNFMTNNGNTLSYPMTPQGQKDYLLDLTDTIIQNNGSGLMYWEPSWISSELCDKWGEGSSYENVALFDIENVQPLPSFNFFDYCNTSPNIEIESSSSVRVYPNPLNSTELHIENAPNKSKWELLDVSGEIILNGVIDKKTRNRVILEGCTKGVYFLSIYLKSSNKRMIERLVIL